MFLKVLLLVTCLEKHTAAANRDWYKNGIW